MRVVIAPDKFKGSMTAVEAARAMSAGVLSVDPAAQVVLCPMADGGEGTVESVVAATGAEEREALVSGPLDGQRVSARWAFIPAGSLAEKRDGGEHPGLLDPGVDTAVIEMAQSSGLWLVPEAGRDPMATSTVGTGQLIREAMDAGCRQIIVGIGGSGTVDGGTGMATALGYRFLDMEGRPLEPTGASLERVASIDIGGRDNRLSGVEFIVASDVDSPLVGEDGAARVFGPQKGATPPQVDCLERGLRQLGELIESEMGVRVLDLPGAGAAGGLGAGLVAFCGARMTSGVHLLAELSGLTGKIPGADLVLTGEGSFDRQTSRGKAPAGVAGIAAGLGVPVVIVAGRLAGGVDSSPGEGVSSYCFLPGPMDLADAMANAQELLEAGTARLVRLLRLLPRR
jgi:glycerate 2-kinase